MIALLYVVAILNIAYKNGFSANENGADKY